MGFGWNIWLPSSAVGTTLEIPARAPGLPANLWIHVAVDTTNWGGFPQGTANSDWKRSIVTVELNVEPGDTPVASVCCMGLAGVRREEQGLFDSDDWGVALDSLGPAGPAALSFFGDFAVAGKSWAGGIWVLADILVLRPSLIPPVPLPYGTYSQSSNPFTWHPDKYVHLVKNIKGLTNDQMTELRRLNGELQSLLDARESQKTDLARPSIKTTSVSLKVMKSDNAGSGPVGIVRKSS
jgi:hypothetical protein